MNEKKTKQKAETGSEVALLAGGCFWGVEHRLRDLPGVLDTEVGYSGGTTDNPGYEEVCSDETGHAETVRVVFDSEQLPYAELLNRFFGIHDPTTENRQGPDVGTQYRSAIFYTSDTQKKVAEEVRDQIDRSRRWTDPVVTEISEAGPFWPAEEYHQDYLLKNPRE
ncbi:MAG: peptide-methionine (S)-S-oxide reductase MsrA [Polyangia bacterium]